MRKVVFAKFSKERREEYQIMTQVMEGNPRRLLKKAASPKAVGHIQKLEASCRILLEEYKDNKEVIICPCSLVEEGTAEFSYIEGESMEERLEKCINQQDWEGLLEEIKLLERIVSGVRHAGEFVRTDSFDAIFGEVRLPEGMRAGAVSNVDIIPTNLIFRNQYYMIDYEWVFDFPVPFSFILFRALFHSVEISKLPREMIDKVYDTVHISEEERRLYLEMEISLQRYITGEYTVLGELYRRMDRQCYMLRYSECIHQSTSDSREGDARGSEGTVQLQDQGQGDFTQHSASEYGHSEAVLVPGGEKLYPGTHRGGCPDRGGLDSNFPGTA